MSGDVVVSKESLCQLIINLFLSNCNPRAGGLFNAGAGEINAMNFSTKFKYCFFLLGCLVIASTSGCSKPDLSTVGKSIVCYAAIYSKGVYKSDNGGISWYPVAANQDDLYLYSKRLIMSPDAKRLYVTTTGGGLFFIDMEKGILNSVKEFKDEDIVSVAFKETSSGQATGYDVLVGKKETGIYRSQMEKDSWEPFNIGLTYRDVNVLSKNEAGLFAGTVKGVFRLDETSRSWIDISLGIRNKNILAIGADSGGKTIYAGAGVFQDKKGRFESIPSLYKSTDSGRTWEKADKGLPSDLLVFSIAVNSQKQDRIYIGTSEGLYRSIDGGKKWTRMKKGLPEKFRALDIKIASMPNSDDLVYAAGANGLYITLDEKNPAWVTRSYGLEETYVSSLLIKAN